MQTLKRSFFLLFFFVLAQQYAAAAPFLSRPEIVGSPGNVTVTYCAGSQFQIKFDIDQFTGTQTFIGQLSDATGNFASATQIGSLSSANGQNKFMTCTIPISQPAGSGYKVRVRASDGTVSQQPAEATIVVVPFPAAANTNLNSYGQDNWKGFAYSYVDPGGGILTNPATIAAIDMYNASKYRGYFVINSLNFDKQWTTGSTGGMPGAVPAMVDTNNVCGSYKVNYAIRLRRKHTFVPANYFFELGSDDGVRLSVDGGATWLIDAFIERQFSTTIPSPNGCAGVFLSGEKDLVIEFFQRFADSRLKVNITGTSLTAPTFPAGFDGSTICTTTASVTLGATPAGGTYTLLGGGSAGCISGDQLIPGVCGVGQKKIIYTTGTGACAKADTATVTIAQGASPLFTGFNTGLSYCSTDPAVTLTPAVTGGTFGGTGVSGSTFTPAKAGVGGPYSITYTISQNGCTASSTQMVTVIAPPNLAFNIQSSVCQSVDSIPLLATPTGGNFTGTGVTGNATNGFFFKPALGTVGNNVVTYTVGAGGCIGTKPFTIAVNTAPTAVAGSNSPLCLNATLNLTTQTSATTGATYSWTGPNGFTSTLQNPSIPNVNTSAAGSYSVSVIAGGCTSAVSSTTVLVSNGLAAPSISTNSPVCVGGVLTLSSTATGVTSYAWTGPNGFTSALPNPSINSVTAANSGQYTLIININGCTSVAGVANISITPLPAIPAATSNSPICENDTLRLNATSSNPSATFLWDGPNGFFSTLQNLKLPPTAASGSYSVRAKVGDCISLPKVLNVVVTPLPAVPAITVADTILCEGTPLALSTAAVAGATYKWTGPNSFTSALQNPTIASVTMAAAGIYTLKVTVNNCSREKTQRFVVKPRPVKAFVASNSPLCNSEVLRMRVTNIQSNVVYNWTGPNGFTSTGDSVRITTQPIVGGTYTVTPTLNGCAAVPTDVVVTLKPITTPPNITANTPICENDKLTIAADSIAGVQYTWTGPNGFTSNKRVIVISKVAPKDSGTYSVVIKGTACPSVPSTKRIEVVPVNNNITIIQDGEVCENKTATLIAPSGYKSYRWNTGDTTRTIKVTTTGTYSVSVRTNIGCPSSGKTTVTRDECEPEIYVASAFTPNGDGNNDVFQIWGNGVTKFEMRIYNRWGENIFFGESLDESWSGRFQNGECPSGDYAYIIDYELTHKGKTTKKRKRGVVNLIR